MVAAGAAALSAMPIAMLWGRLPDPMAIHWSLDGLPNGSMSKLGFMSFNVVMVAVFLFASTRARPVRDGGRRDVDAVYVMAFGGMLVPSLSTFCVALNIDSPDWSHAAPMSWTLFVIMFIPPVSATTAAFVARALLGRPAGDEPDSTHPGG
jgi:hypothetical protein